MSTESNRAQHPWAKLLEGIPPGKLGRSGLDSTECTDQDRLGEYMPKNLDIDKALRE